MKQFIILTASLIFLGSTACSGNDKLITADQLPVEAARFIEKYYPGQTVSYAKMDNDAFKKSYEVAFPDGSTVEFDGKGEWKNVESKSTPVPAGIVPGPIMNYITANYPNAKIKEIDRDKRDYEIKLGNGMELKFDLKFNLIGIDN